MNKTCKQFVQDYGRYGDHINVKWLTFVHVYCHGLNALVADKLKINSHKLYRFKISLVLHRSSFIVKFSVFFQ